MNLVVPTDIFDSIKAGSLHKHKLVVPYVSLKPLGVSDLTDFETGETLLEAIFLTRVQMLKFYEIPSELRLRIYGVGDLEKSLGVAQALPGGSILRWNTSVTLIVFVRMPKTYD